MSLRGIVRRWVRQLLDRMAPTVWRLFPKPAPIFIGTHALFEAHADGRITIELAPGCEVREGAFLVGPEATMDLRYPSSESPKAAGDRTERTGGP